MEYLMTYGWAILIIAVVLGALFQLGIFNASTFSPKAPPGACQVFRPNGPGTTSFINLEGVCNGELPQYVGVFNGQTSNISFSQTSGFPQTTQKDISAFAWIRENPGAPSYPDIFAIGYGQINTYSVSTNVYEPRMCTANGCWQDPSLQYSANQWVMIGFTYNSTTHVAVSYMNGVAGTPQSLATPNPQATYAFIGGGSVYFFSGYLANIQWYNVSLTANEVKALYNEGIGGAPVVLRSIQGWWPLNGDAKDYSGNNNHGKVIRAVSFTSSWESSYSAP